MTTQSFATLVAAQDYSSAVKVLDASIEETRQDYATALHRLVQLHLNRGLCNQRLHLNRKALKDYDAALALMPSNVNALLRKGQVLQALGKPAEARIVWQTAASVADPSSDLEAIVEIHDALNGADQQNGSADASATAATADPSSKADEAGRGTAVANAATSNGPSTASPASSAPAAPASRAPSPASPAPVSSSSKSTINKGFLRSSTDASKVSSAAGTVKLASATNSNRSSSSSSADALVEIDCVAEQQQSAQRPVAGSFGAQVQQMAQNSVALQIAINQINAGQVEQAEALLDGILSSNPRELSALVARGTARALMRKLKEAVEDFTTAIDVEPRYPDTYKRRGQARSALGDTQGALEDLEKAAKLLDTLPGAEQMAAGGPADCYSERGMLYQKLRDYRRAVKELVKATDLDHSNAQAFNYLGLCRVSMGDIRDGCRAYERAIELQPEMREAWLNLGQALKEEGRVKEAERALTKAMTTADGAPCMAAYRLLATMRQGQGRQADAIKVLDKALSCKREEQKVELLYLRAICFHAQGYARKAVADYDACMNCKPRMDEGPVGEESRMFQFLCFYQREMAMFVYHNMDKRSADFCLDTELSPVFKECWCKKGPPSQELFTSYRVQPPLPAEGRSSSSGRDTPPAPECNAAVEQVAALTSAADTLGTLLQNHHQGFLPNIRQQRAAGYAAIELGQAVRALLAERRAGREGLWVNSEGSSGQGGCSGRHLFGWRDAMDIVVKWRQLSEPADQVVWVDLLTQREFEQGFGSHTPMYSGQTKCVRYYMNFSRAMDLAKECLLENGHAYDAQNRPVPLGSNDKQEAVRKACTALELYRVIGQDSWVVVPLHSILKADKDGAALSAPAEANGSSTTSSNANSNESSTSATSSSGKDSSSGSKSSKSSTNNRRPGVIPSNVPAGCIEGTRLTLVKVPNQPDAVEFSIRTPVTPPRWKEFDAELEAAWERLIAALLAGAKPAIATAIMSYAYYWYNFMPLARGTAAVGYTTMLGLFWAAGMPITAPIPKDYQVDWEAILARHPQQFIDRLSLWFVPDVACPPGPLPSSSIPASCGRAAASASRSVSDSSSNGISNGSKVVAAAAQLPDTDVLPLVGDILATIRQRLNALNGPDARPV